MEYRSKERQGKIIMANHHFCQQLEPGLNSKADALTADASVCFAVGRPWIQSPFRVIPKDLKNGIHSFPAWRSAFRGGCGEQAGKFACCVLGQGT